MCLRFLAVVNIVTAKGTLGTRLFGHSSFSSVYFSVKQRSPRWHDKGLRVFVTENVFSEGVGKVADFEADLFIHLPLKVQFVHSAYSEQMSKTSGSQQQKLSSFR